MKKHCQTLYPWLKANLGKHCLAPLTGTDAKALDAALQIIVLYSYHVNREVLKAFSLVVSCMQFTTQELAYHAIAHVMDWHDRSHIWDLCDLPPIVAPRICANEPSAR